MNIKIPDNLDEDEEIEIGLNLHSYTQKNTPNKLFRYRICSEYHIDAFKNNELWMSKPSKFNDPHDALLYINKQRIVNQLNSLSLPDSNSIRNQLKEDKNFRNIQSKLLGKEFVAEFIDDKTNQLTLDKKELEELDLHNNEITNSVITKSIKHVKQASYVACFSEDIKSTLMWSHYSDNHKGFAVEYDFKSMHGRESFIEESFFIDQKIFPVIYSNNRYDATGYFEHQFMYNFYRQMGINVNFPFYDKLFWYKSVLVKSLDWSYEQEWRIIKLSNNEIQNDEADYINVPNVRPNAIYFGCEIEKDRRNKLIEICNEKGIKMYDMVLELHDKEFQFNSVIINDA